MPGDLVHLEGSPTVVDGKRLPRRRRGRRPVRGHEPRHAGRQGNGPAAIQKILDAKWADLQAKYENDKKKDPIFAVPPSDDQLPKPAPVLLWQQGKDKWHVDAPVTVVGDRVLVASAFLDKEQLGDRALFCLDAKTGDIVWRKPLTDQPVGRPVGDRQDGRRQRQHHRLRPQGARRAPRAS